MWNIIKAENLKLKHSFANKLPLMAPLLTVLMALALTGGLGNDLPAGAWNWWCIMLLPGMLAILCYLDIQKDKKIRFHNTLSAFVPIEKGWMGKIAYCGMCLLFANLILFAGVLVAGAVFGTTITLLEGLVSAILLSIAYLWEVPLYLFLSAKYGMFPSILSCMILSIGGTMTLADSSLWWLNPASIPVRLLCPTLGIQPNGLPIPAGSELFDRGVILPGVMITLTWFVILALVTSHWFKRLEAK